jgi:hypothetical protein
MGMNMTIWKKDTLFCFHPCGARCGVRERLEDRVFKLIIQKLSKIIGRKRSGNSCVTCPERVSMNDAGFCVHCSFHYAPEFKTVHFS